ncbi:MAG: tetratricopeptide repeat protein [Proteobacteria bacterium]|nr:tetratricopeptide repeat protein [Pseudomonadota bacterium]
MTVKTRFLIIISWVMLPLFFTLAHGADCEKAKRSFNEAYGLDNDTPGLIRKEQLYKEATYLCPSLAEACNNLGDVYERQGRFEEAAEQYKKTIELRPHVPYPYFGIGDVYYKTNRPKEAVEWYEKGLKYDPGDIITKERLALARDMSKGSVVKAETIRNLFSSTRGPAEIVSITFGEALIPFEYNKTNIVGSAVSQIAELGKALRDISGVFEIAGHTDIRGSDGYNRNLSMKRAQAVVDYIVQHYGISKSNLIAKGYGKRMPLCSDNSEACHSLNRRVEIIRKAGYAGSTRGIQTRSISSAPETTVEQKVIVEAGFFFQKKGERKIKILKDGMSLKSRSDRYLIFFRPLQDCYVYVVQEDAKGNVNILFPGKDNNARVLKEKDYWVPAPGKAYTLDDTRGEEKLYLLVTSWPLQGEIESLSSGQDVRGVGGRIEGVSLKEQVRGAIRSLKTRAILVVPVVESLQADTPQAESPETGAPQHISEDELTQQPNRINALLERIEGEGGWVKIVQFRHE